MPAELLCVRCGRPIEGVEAIPLGRTGMNICQGCADWQRTRASDREDLGNRTGLDPISPAARPKDTVRRV